jgi:hypothetical protein
MLQRARLPLLPHYIQLDMTIFGEV